MMHNSDNKINGNPNIVRAKNTTEVVVPLYFTSNAPEIIEKVQSALIKEGLPPTRLAFDPSKAIGGKNLHKLNIVFELNDTISSASFVLGVKGFLGSKKTGFGSNLSLSSAQRAQA